MPWVEAWNSPWRVISEWQVWAGRGGRGEGQGAARDSLGPAAPMEPTGTLLPHQHSATELLRGEQTKAALEDQEVPHGLGSDKSGLACYLCSIGFCLGLPGPR